MTDIIKTDDETAIEKAQTRLLEKLANDRDGLRKDVEVKDRVIAALREEIARLQQDATKRAKMLELKTRNLSMSLRYAKRKCEELDKAKMEIERLRVVIDTQAEYGQQMRKTVMQMMSKGGVT